MQGTRAHKSCSPVVRGGFCDLRWTAARPIEVYEFCLGTPASEGASRSSGRWITAAVSVAGLIVIAVVVAATVTSNGKGVGFGPVTRAQDRAVQADLRNALTAEKTIYTDNQAYSAKIAEMRSIESSLDWGGRLDVVVDKSVCPPSNGQLGIDPANRFRRGRSNRHRTGLRPGVLPRQCRLPRRAIDVRHHVLAR